VAAGRDVQCLSCNPIEEDDVSFSVGLCEETKEVHMQEEPAPTITGRGELPPVEAVNSSAVPQQSKLLAIKRDAVPHEAFVGKPIRTVSEDRSQEGSFNSGNEPTPLGKCDSSLFSAALEHPRTDIRLASNATRKPMQSFIWSKTLGSSLVLSPSTSRIFRRVQQGTLILRHYYAWYSAYLLVVITIGTSALLLVPDGMAIVEALYLAFSVVTMTGLSPVNFPALPWIAHLICWLMIILGSPIVMSILPVCIRYWSFTQIKASMRSRENSRRMKSQVSRRLGVAFRGILTTSDDEYFALKFLSILVFTYWLCAQLLGWIMLWAILWHHTGKSTPWHAMFLATSAFHNAGLVSLPQGLPISAPLLFVVMLLILCGNTCFPLVLRFLVWACYALSRDARKSRVLRLLLQYPRTCYTHLFPAYATRWLCVLTPLLIFVQIVALCASDLWAGPAGGAGDAELLKHFNFQNKILAILFQSIATRTAGFSVVNLELLSPTSAFVFCICMWISVCPVTSVIRSTTRVDGRVVSEYFLGEVKQQKQKDAESVKQQLSSFMGQNMLPLIILFYSILLMEQYYTTDAFIRNFRITYIVFEFCSAYGTVGLSMSSKAHSRSGEWCVPAQILLMVVMFLGRLRGLPESIDPAVRLSENDEEEYGTPASSNGVVALVNDTVQRESSDTNTVSNRTYLRGKNTPPTPNSKVTL